MKKIIFILCCILASCTSETISNDYSSNEIKEFETNFKSYEEQKSTIAPFRTRAGSTLTEEEILNIAERYDSVTNEFINDNKKILIKYRIPISKEYHDLLLLDKDVAKAFMRDNFSQEFNDIFWSRMDYYCSIAATKPQAPKSYNTSSLNPMENLILSELETTYELKDMSLEILDRQIPTKNNDKNLAQALKLCEEQMNTALTECTFWFAIGVTIEIISMPETVGIGTLAAHTANCAQYIRCIHQASKAKSECDKRARGN